MCRCVWKKKIDVHIYIYIHIHTYICVSLYEYMCNCTLALLPWFPFLAHWIYYFACCVLCVYQQARWPIRARDMLSFIIAVASHGPTPCFVSVATRVYALFIHMTRRPRLNGGDERVRVRKKREAMWLPPWNPFLPQQTSPKKKKRRSRRESKRKKKQKKNKIHR